MSVIFCPMCHRETPAATTCEHCSASTRLRDRWVLESMLGHGASGYTWHARDVETDDVVAIKELSFRRLTDLKSLELFEREGEALEGIDSKALATLLRWILLLGTTALTTSFVLAMAAQQFLSPRRNPIGVAAITGSFIATFALIMIFFHAPVEHSWLPSTRAALSQHWFGERNGELLIARPLKVYGCSIVVQRASDGRVVRYVPTWHTWDNRCEFHYTEKGSIWIQPIEGRFLLFDIRSGELLADSATEVDGEVRHEMYAGETVLLKLPDGTLRRVGVQRAPSLEREGRFVSTDHWVYSADLPNPPGFRKQVFVRDAACGALMHMHTTEFGEGDWQIAQVGHSAPQWTRTAVELTGQPNIEGVVVGHDLC